jgi:undecaprenyl pyrophosphate phosphatase UppP
MKKMMVKYALIPETTKPTTNLVFGVLLGIAVLLDTRRPHAREILAWKDIVFIGVMQTLALVPGVSRSAN